MEDGLTRRIAESALPSLAGVADSPAKGAQPADGLAERQSTARTEPGTDTDQTAVASDAGAGDDDAPEWPDETVEAAMLAEQRERDDIVPQAPRSTRAGAAPDADDAAVEPLPKLDALIDRIPPDVRETLDELFRARFTSVQRVPKQALKE